MYEYNPRKYLWYCILHRLLEYLSMLFYSILIARNQIFQETAFRIIVSVCFINKVNALHLDIIRILASARLSLENLWILTTVISNLPSLFWVVTPSFISLAKSSLL